MGRIIMRDLLATLLAIALTSCGGRSGEGAPTAGESANRTLGADATGPSGGLESRFADFSKDVVRGEKGEILKESKRSNFEGRQMAMIGGERTEKAFATSRFSKKDWAGSKRLDNQRYEGAGRNRWNESEYFLRQQAREASSVARAQGNQFRGGGTFETAGAREQNQRRIVGSNNLQSEVQQESFQPPLKFNKSDYERLSVEDSNNLLGR